MSTRDMLTKNEKQALFRTNRRKVIVSREEIETIVDYIKEEYPRFHEAFVGYEWQGYYDLVVRWFYKDSVVNTHNVEIFVTTRDIGDLPDNADYSWKIIEKYNAKQFFWHMCLEEKMLSIQEAKDQTWGRICWDKLDYGDFIEKIKLQGYTVAKGKCGYGNTTDCYILSNPLATFKTEIILRA